jgi:hypothetical protein
LEVNQQVIQSQTKDNLENQEEYVRFVETPYWNLMLDKQVLKIEESPTGHMLFLPQEMVWWDVCTRGLQRKHSSRQRFPWREMQSTIHLNERM